MKFINSLILIVCYSISAVADSSRVSIVENEHIPGKSARLQIVSVENNTQDSVFEIFPALKESAGLILPEEVLALPDNKGVDLGRLYPVIISCAKGSYFPLFMMNGRGAVSGQAPEGYDGPYYVSMWLSYPHVAESVKLHIPYVIEKDKQGKIGVIIGSRGDYRLVAIENVQFVN